MNKYGFFRIGQMEKISGQILEIDILKMQQLH
jgi:hypothetical protein